jgi:hypothetical protein
MSPDVTDLNIADLADEEVRLAEQAERIQQRREHIKNLLREHLPVGNHPAGPYTVHIRPGARRIDPRKVTAVYPPGEYPDLYETALSTTRVRRFLSPDALEAYTSQAAASVVID